MICVAANLHFSGNCIQAIKLYETAFGAEIKVLLYNPDANPQDL